MMLLSVCLKYEIRNVNHPFSAVMEEVFRGISEVLNLSPTIKMLLM